MTIYDIAKEAGVAASTVSRVINNKPGVKLETQEKVRAILAKYNFTPNISARGLVMQSTKLIGILVQDIRVIHHIESAFIVEQEMAKLGYSSIIIGTGVTAAQKADAIRTVEQRRVEGVVLIGSMFENDEVKKSVEQHLSNIPVVVINGQIDLPNVSSILADEYGGVKECVDFLQKRGCRELALVIDSDSPSNRQKIRGFLEKIENAPCEIVGDDVKGYLVKGVEGTAQGGYGATADMLEQNPRIDGIIFATDIIAMGGVRAILDSGRKIPGDVAVIGIDNSVFSEVSIPKLTALDNRPDESSKMAVTFLKEGLEGNMIARKLVLNTAIIDRETT